MKVSAVHILKNRTFVKFIKALFSKANLALITLHVAYICEWDPSLDIHLFSYLNMTPNCHAQCTDTCILCIFHFKKMHQLLISRNLFDASKSLRVYINFVTIHSQVNTQLY